MHCWRKYHYDLKPLLPHQGRVCSQVCSCQCHVAPSLIIIEFESFYDWRLKVGAAGSRVSETRVSVLSLSGSRERVNNSPTPLRYVDIIIFHFLRVTVRPGSEYHYRILTQFSLQTTET